VVFDYVIELGVQFRVTFGKMALNKSLN